MNQGEIRVITEDLLDWVFDKGVQHGKEFAARQEQSAKEREQTAEQKQRADFAICQRDTANTHKRKLAETLQAFVHRAELLNDMNTGPVELAKITLKEAGHS